jgi:hypothetical protein
VCRHIGISLRHWLQFSSNDNDGCGNHIYHLLLQRFSKHKFIIATNQSVSVIKSGIIAYGGCLIQEREIMDNEMTVLIVDKFVDQRRMIIVQAALKRKLRIRQSDSNFHHPCVSHSFHLFHLIHAILYVAILSEIKALILYNDHLRRMMHLPHRSLLTCSYINELTPTTRYAHHIVEEQGITNDNGEWNHLERIPCNKCRIPIGYHEVDPSKRIHATHSLSHSLTHSYRHTD